MGHRFIRAATLLLALDLSVCGSAFSQSSAPGTPASASVGVSAALDVGDCPDVAYGFELNKVYACDCPLAAAAGLPAAGPVYGSLVYANDSNLCAAAVHAGVLKPATAGRVTLQVIASPPVFKGSTRNGIKSEVWPAAAAAAFQFANGQ